MADITKVLFWRHLRSEASAHVILHKGGSTAKSGRGLAFWFMPLDASVSELPVDDRELTVMFHGRSQDFQEVSVQASIGWRVHEPERLSTRVDFSIDLDKGAWRKTPLEAVSGIVTELAQQLCLDLIARMPLQAVLVDGLDRLRQRIDTGLAEDEGLSGMGIEIVGVRVSAVRPEAQVEKALQTPAREAIQQDADKATFERRAMAVERERAIQENELQNRIELARREEELIQRQGQNDRRRAEEEAAAGRIRAEAEAQNKRIEAAGEAERIALVEGARVEAERATIGIYEKLPQHVMLGLAAREMAEHLPNIEQLIITPDLLAPALRRFAAAE